MKAARGETTHGYSRILVTGGAGFIGSHLVDRLVAEGCEVTVLDDLSRGSVDNVRQHLDKKTFRFVKGDVRNPRVVREAVEGVDAVFHLAAVVSVPVSMDEPLLVHEVNVTGTLNGLKASLDAGVKRFVYASSCAVYGEPKTLPVTEERATAPVSPYGVSKLAAEHYCRVFHRAYGLETVALRHFNVYGARQTVGPYSGVITIFVRRILNDQPPVIYGDGEQTRDFVHVDDVVEANVLALNAEGALGQVFNVATGEPTTVNQLAQLLIEIADRPHLRPVHAEPRPGDIRISHADVNKAESVLGYKPEVSLERGLTRLVKQYVT